MSRSLRSKATLAPLAAAVLAAIVVAAIAGCGNELSPNAVARVGDKTIEQAEFDHWLQAAARSQQAAVGPAGDVAVPDPPDFEQCVAAKEEQAREAVEQIERQGQGGEQAIPSEDELRQQCSEEYELLKEQVMQFLIQAEAIQQEAAEREIEVSDEEVEARLDDLREQSFPNDRAYERFLEQSGMSEEDLLFRVRLDLLVNEIREDVVDAEGEVTDEEVEAYYEENQSTPPIGQPEQREVRVVVAETEEEAQEAREAIEGGQSFAEVAREHSVDPASRDRGGRLTVQETDEGNAFDDAVFAAAENELIGPVETEVGWYVFEVTDIQRGQTRTLDESREAITEILTTQRETEALGEFQQEFEEDVRESTVCAEDYIVVGCGNGPEPEEATQPGVPGAPPPGAPPEGGAPPAPAPGEPAPAPGEPAPAPGSPAPAPEG